MKAVRFLLIIMIIGAAIGLARRRPIAPTTVRNWPSDLPSPDSVVHSLAVIVGSPPTLLASCGPHHLLMTYVDAPIDIRPERSTGPDGRAVPLISVAQRSRHAVAAVLAIGLWSAMPYGRYDTVTVRLIRREHFPAGFGPDRGEFTLAPLEESPHPLTAQPVWGSAEICAQVI